MHYGMALRLHVLNWLASLPTADCTGCQALVVGDVCLGVGICRPKRAVSNRNCKLPKQPCLLKQPKKAPSQTTENQDLEGQIAALRAMMAVSQHQIETVVISQANRLALELLHPDNMPVRTAACLDAGVCL